MAKIEKPQPSRLTPSPQGAAKSLGAICQAGATHGRGVWACRAEYQTQANRHRTPSWLSGSSDARPQSIQIYLPAGDPRGMRVVTRDHLFSSPSMAAMAVMGRSANGWIEWKAANGKTLDEVKRQVVGVVS
ncbi:MAG: DUF4357 domain-containing protein [Rhodoferax sp.]|nr:DUF4357 domain-containing protein [Rhodoferax sp.]